MHKPCRKHHSVKKEQKPLLFRMRSKEGPVFLWIGLVCAGAQAFRRCYFFLGTIIMSRLRPIMRASCSSEPISAKSWATRFINTNPRS